MAKAKPNAGMARLESREAAHAWLLLRKTRALAADSRRVGNGDAFVAWPGHASDGRQYVAAALAAGASACLVEADGVEAFGFAADSRVGALRGLKAAAGDIASRFLATPSSKLAVVAVTGTNGKTSTAWWIAQALATLGRRCGVIGTLGIGEPPLGRAAETPVADSLAAMRSTGLTTPDPVTLQNALNEFVARGVAACAVEASSIGIAEHRLTGTQVEVAVFTNFTQDHLDYHGDMRAYWQAKAQLFAWPGLRSAVVNLDDAQGLELADSLAGSAVDCWTVSMRGESARLRAQALRHDRDGLAFDVVEGDMRVAIATPLIGDYNAGNLLCVIGVLRALGVPLADAATACAALTPVPGRMQRVGVTHVAGAATAASNAASRGANVEAVPEVVVDYAHTPDALEKALAALAPLAKARGGVLWCVFGCGGNRDAAKRPLMGAIACRLAGRVVVTSDNPRLESPDLILAQILAGAIGHDEIDVIEKRAEAIAHAVGSAAAEDVVLIAGKGHEDYQDIGGAKFPFSDAAQAAKALAGRISAATATTETTMSTATMMTLDEAARMLPDARVVGSVTTAIARVHSDTRSIAPGRGRRRMRGSRS